MNRSITPYRRMPGRSFSLLQWETAWLADDHVLTVQAMPAGDACRRFYFRDIEAVIIRRTAARLWINVLMGALALVALYPLMYLFAFSVFERALAITAAVALVPVVLAIINTARGPACEVRFQTPVQTEKIAAWGRVATAERSLAMLRPLIIEAQRAAATAAEAAPPQPPSNP